MILGSKRWPPMVGIVGFDGGYRPAVALALPPNELTSDEGEQEGGGPEDQTGACCNQDGSCNDDVTEFDCTSSGGIFQGVGTRCVEVTCEPFSPTGACCVDGACSITTEADCGGIYLGDGTTCDADPCNPCTLYGPFTQVTFDSVTLPGCCVCEFLGCVIGGSFKIVDCSGGLPCVTINSLWNNGVGTNGGHYAGDTHQWFGVTDCSGDPDDNPADDPLSVYIGCNTLNISYPLGWYVVAGGIRPIFAAFGITDPTVPISNELSCGVIHPYTGFIFAPWAQQAVGESGTATLS